MKIFYFLLLWVAVMPCNAQRSCATYDYAQKHATETSLIRQSVQNYAGSVRDTLPSEIITIPVVVHILYNNSVQNISEAQVLSQLDVLNKDYRRLNNVQNIPAAFVSLSADSKIVFCLAKTDPAGKQTNGIIRKYTQTTSWSADDKMKFSASQGDDAWDPKSYLNIWVCDLFGRNLGYASLPGSAFNKDGVVIQYNVFGTTGTVRTPFNKGRTATHEIGHWLGLRHLWGDALCGDDMIADTPPQKSYNNGCPSFPHISDCSVNASGDMFMNFMDFTDDGCMSMFTNDQANKMRGMFALGNPRNSFLNSSACNSVSPEAGEPVPDTAVNISTAISLYPNPANGLINIEAKNSTEVAGKMLRIYNVLGREVKAQLLLSQKTIISINNFPAGLYVVKIGDGKKVNMMRFIKL